MEVRYTIRQAAEKTGVKTYVLRYWEDELALVIQRNEMGHRYYTGYDIQLFMNIKELKKRGLQLRAIRELLPQISDTISGKAMDPEHLLTADSLNEKQMGEKEIMFPEDCENISGYDAKILEFQSILERLITKELRERDEEEEKCHSLDLAIRRQQMARREAAASSERKNGKRRKKYMKI